MIEVGRAAERHPGKLMCLLLRIVGDSLAVRYGEASRRVGRP